ncbi:MAG: DUF1292 domain-containing protein [Oscillospiraceae bacterium]
MAENDEELDYTPTDYNDEHYLAVVPCADDEENLEEDTDLIIMRVCEDEDGEEFLDVVDDDEELCEVSGIFADRLSELFDIDTGE